MHASFQLLPTGDDVFREMLQSIASATSSIRLEMYIYTNCLLGVRIRDALIAARLRGVGVQVLVDSWGALNLSDSFWEGLITAGGEYRRFNPLRMNQSLFRDHRKLLVVDDALAFIGGCNIAEEYEGDGVTCGWCDLGLRISGTMAREMAIGFDQMFKRAQQGHQLVRLIRSRQKKKIHISEGDLFLSGPGWGKNYFSESLMRDISRAQTVLIASAYFLPSRKMRRELMKVVRRGGKVQLILAGKSDVPISLLATRSLYQRLLRAGVEIYEYAPQILHAKLMIVDQAVYLGSANLDTRSLQINYELMIRMPNSQLTASARKRFAEWLDHSQKIDPTMWKASRTFWNRWKERFAYLLLARVDPYFAQRQLRSLR